MSSQAIFKYGIKTELSHVTKPKMKNNAPIIIIDLVVVLSEAVTEGRWVEFAIIIKELVVKRANVLEL